MHRPVGLIKHADELRKTSRNKLVIRAEAREVLTAMYSEMVNANRDGRNSITFQVPKFYASIGSDESTILIITTTILRELNNADYEVAVSDIKHAYLFDIRWDTELSYTDKKNMTDYMRKHMTGTDDHSSKVG
jgi:hypothetical protein